ncbi:hypothetical protein GCM10011351_20640 [Paraliobacillus quinghaiensis]|uniref:Antitoxin VbhA domain-containing protein n=1 Tax=Paraliobacillus quinghaiensis TaxID=470815 RepID=A0A917WWC2_9BACI|nr:hypothetical protein [Paraliobacillus quinghaiensis]GGM34550.1 hypothetical protein GCM10011351_20640 [Paraliobacillus quinghaiensis]
MINEERGKPITAKEFEEHWKEINYQLEIEGLKPTTEDKEAIRKVLTGEMDIKRLTDGI